MCECGMCFGYYGLQTEDGTHVNLYAFLFVSMASSCVYELGVRRSRFLSENCPDFSMYAFGGPAGTDVRHKYHFFMLETPPDLL